MTEVISTDATWDVFFVQAGASSAVSMGNGEVPSVRITVCAEPASAVPSQNTFGLCPDPNTSLPRVLGTISALVELGQNLGVSITNSRRQNAGSIPVKRSAYG